jgi:galactitol PTS system EIIB component
MKKRKEFKNALALIVCADGVATSSIVIVTLRDELEERGVEPEFVQGRVLDVESTVKSRNFDFIISTAGTSFDTGDIPIISGVPFLTGIGRDQTIDQIMGIINKKA